METIHRTYWICLIRNDAGQTVPVRRARWATPAKGFHRFEAECSCGWKTRTGGAIPAAINREIAAHRAQSDEAVTA